MNFILYAYQCPNDINDNKNDRWWHVHFYRNCIINFINYQVFNEFAIQFLTQYLHLDLTDTIWAH
jgi:hypothetical protein